MPQQLDSIMQYTKEDLEKMMLTQRVSQLRLDKSEANTSQANYDKVVEMRSLIMIHGSPDNFALATDLAFQKVLGKMRQAKHHATVRCLFP